MGASLTTNAVGGSGSALVFPSGDTVVGGFLIGGWINDGSYKFASISFIDTTPIL
jgi:hypothetical protein